MFEFLNTNAEIIAAFTALVTVVLTVIMTVLTFQIKRLTKHDKQKGIAINELKQQTNRLTDLYTLQIAPRFSIAPSNTDYVAVKNIGADAFNLKFETDKPYKEIYERILKGFNGSFSSHTEKSFRYDAFSEHTFTFAFEDITGKKYKQILDVRTRRFSNLIEL